MDQMDSQTLRLVLAVIGVFIIAAIFIWGQYKKKLLDFINQRGEYDELEAEEELPCEDEVSMPAKAGHYGGHSTAKDIDPPITFNDLDAGEKNVVMEKPKPSTPKPALPENARREPPRTDPLGAPFLIQISVVSRGGFFNGLQLRDALDDLRLIYGDMGIYHRYDREYRVPLFSVASLVEPGTFPIKDMDNFECPGIVLFFQPPQVDDPLEVFDDLVATCRELAMRLGGTEWDEKRQPLTIEKITQMRGRLREAY
ncbi:MAG: cell division protein ZipA C-terminal FtsZ-binding domain-containing protein [Candidatus Methylumidiphilus sp.]